MSDTTTDRDRWQPTPNEEQYVRLIISMCTDCLMHNGTSDCATFTGNLRMIADRLDHKETPS